MTTYYSIVCQCNIPGATCQTFIYLPGNGPAENSNSPSLVGAMRPYIGNNRLDIALG